MQPPDQAQDTDRKRSGPVTESEVWSACDVLHQDAIRITIPQIRMNLGNRGSNTTISRYIDTWRHRVPSRPDQAQPVPQTLEAPIQSMWETMRREARAAFDRDREELRIKSLELQQRHEKDQEQLRAADRTNQALQGIVDAVVERLTKLEHAAFIQANALPKAFGELTDKLLTALAPLNEFPKIDSSLKLVNAELVAIRSDQSASDKAASSREAGHAGALKGLSDAITGNQDFFLRGIQETREANRILQGGFKTVLDRFNEARQVAAAESKLEQEAAASVAKALGNFAAVNASLRDTVSSGLQSHADALVVIDQRISAQEKSVSTVLERLDPMVLQISEQLPAISGKIDNLSSSLVALPGPAPEKT